MIKIRSIYSLKSFRVFQKYTLKNIFILAYCCGVILVGIGILFAFLQKSAYSAYLLCGILLPIAMHIFYKILEVENLNKNIYLRDAVVQIFTFNEEDIELEQVSKFDTIKERYLYKDIIKVVKYKKYYFMYINRVQAFIINNEDYIWGSEKELDELLKKVKADRFVIKSKRIRKQKKIENTK